jgi:hypothetical protein
MCQIVGFQDMVLIPVQKANGLVQIFKIIIIYYDSGLSIISIDIGTDQNRFLIKYLFLAPWMSINSYSLTPVSLVIFSQVKKTLNIYGT